MRIDLTAGTDVIDALAPRITIRPVAFDDDANLRVAHRISQESFSEHYSHVDQPYDAWFARLTQRGGDYSQVFLGDLEGEPVGLLLTNRQFEEEQDAGRGSRRGVAPRRRRQRHQCAPAL